MHFEAKTKRTHVMQRCSQPNISMNVTPARPNSSHRGDLSIARTNARFGKGSLSSQPFILFCNLMGVRQTPRLVVRHSLPMVLVCIGGLACSSPPPRPSDASLVAEFKSRRSDYEHLLSMFREDSALGRVASDFTRSANFFSGTPLRPTDPPTEGRLKGIDNSSIVCRFREVSKAMTAST